MFRKILVLGERYHVTFLQRDIGKLWTVRNKVMVLNVVILRCSHVEVADNVMVRCNLRCGYGYVIL